MTYTIKNLSVHLAEHYMRQLRITGVSKGDAIRAVLWLDRVPPVTRVYFLKQWAIANPVLSIGDAKDDGTHGYVERWTDRKARREVDRARADVARDPRVMSMADLIVDAVARGDLDLSKIELEEPITREAPKFEAAPRAPKLTVHQKNWPKRKAREAAKRAQVEVVAA